jgi:hypothetical protein
MRNPAAYRQPAYLMFSAEQEVDDHARTDD